MSIEDLYPSRTGAGGALLERRDPVVHCVSQPSAGPLSYDQAAQFERDGFLFFEGVFDAGEVGIFARELNEVCEQDAVSGSPCTIVEPDSGDVRSIFALTSFSQVFFMLSRNDLIVGIAKQLLGGDIYLHQSHAKVTPGFSGGKCRWHSNFETWHVEDGMPRMRAISCRIALTEANEFNGALVVIPGSHKRFAPCTEAGPDPESLRTLIDEGGVVAPKGPAGSVLFYDCNLMHGSAANVLPYPRMEAIFAYNSAANTLVEPFGGQPPRPEHLANREAIPITPIEMVASYATMRNTDAG